MERKEIQVPYSTGRKVPKLQIPELTCDTHCHIFDPVRFPYKPTDTRNQPPATVDVYRMLQSRLGMKRCVIVTPSSYGADNRCTLDAVKQLGKDARAVIVLRGDESKEELQQLHVQGVRGVRFNVASGASDNIEQIQRTADQIVELGWHIVFWMSADLTVKYAKELEKLPCQIVFDHRGHLPADQGIRHEAFGVITDMMKEKHAFVKLSALYHDSVKENYEDTIAVGKAYAEIAPEQLLWATDWPHHSEFITRKEMPDDAKLLDSLIEQIPDEKTRNQILVDNPARLYGF